jgi:hypothetical protein
MKDKFDRRITTMKAYPTEKILFFLDVAYKAGAMENEGRIPAMNTKDLLISAIEIFHKYENNKTDPNKPWEYWDLIENDLYAEYHCLLESDEDKNEDK